MTTRSKARSRPRSASSRSWRSCEFPPRPRRPARRATELRRRRALSHNKITGTFPVALCDVGSCYAKRGDVGGYAKRGNSDLVAPCVSTDCCDFGASPAPIDSTVGVFGKCYNPATTTVLRVPPASPTPGAPRDRPSASQVPLRQQDRRHDPDRDRPAHGAGGAASFPRVPRRPGPRDRPSASQVPLQQSARRPDPDRDRPAHGAEQPASSLRVPDARRAARPPLDVVGTSATTRSTARSRPRSACSRH